MRNGLRILIGTLACAALAACTVHEQEAPILQGPSELALRVHLVASPDSLLMDGTSRSEITIDADGPDGRPVSNLAVRIQMAVNGTIQDFGTLSSRSATTGNDGIARVTYTAPLGAAEAEELGTVVTIIVTPIGSNQLHEGDFRGQAPRQVDIRLVPRNIVLPPNSGPTPAFTISPTPATSFTSIIFDASGTIDEGVPCAARCTYSWTFGDGGSGSGMVVNHEFRQSGTFAVTLRVVDDRNQSASLTQSINVTAASPPTASFTFSPNPAAVSQDIFFTAAASKATPPRTLVGYDWDFGSGRFGSGVTAVKKYDTAGSYTVTLTVTDDAGQQATASQTVAVGGTGTGIIPDLTFSPSGPTTSTTVFFDASGTTGPSPIVEYRFTFGDNTPDVAGTSPTTTHRFLAAGTYVVRLTVRDSAGRTATMTINVSIAP